MGDKDFLASRRLEFGPELGCIIRSYCRPDDLADWAWAFPKHSAHLSGSINSSTGQISWCEWHRRMALTQVWMPCQHSLSLLSYACEDIFQLQGKATCMHSMWVEMGHIPFWILPTEIKNTDRASEMTWQKGDFKASVTLHKAMAHSGIDSMMVCQWEEVIISLLH